jgi:hypothetical protein
METAIIMLGHNMDNLTYSYKQYYIRLFNIAPKKIIKGNK